MNHEFDTGDMVEILEGDEVRCLQTHWHIYGVYKITHIEGDVAQIEDEDGDAYTAPITALKPSNESWDDDAEEEDSYPDEGEWLDEDDYARHHPDFYDEWEE